LHDWIQFVWPQKIKSDTGFVKPNLDKFANMVIYFVIKEKPCKTKLNKLLFYSDFLHYKNHLKAISGSRYRAISLGPVPTEYDAIYDWMNNNNFIYMVEEFKDCGVIEIMETNKYFDESLFVESEIEILNNVYEKFKDYLINDLKEYTLEEPAWKENVINKNIINYQKWGFEVKG
jgi:uncharacterized phage-associated protein